MGRQARHRACRSACGWSRRRRRSCESPAAVETPLPVAPCRPNPRARRRPPCRSAVQPASASHVPGVGGGCRRRTPYVPRGRLTVAPQPLGVVDVPFPPDVEWHLRTARQGPALIDETGSCGECRRIARMFPGLRARHFRDLLRHPRFRPGEMDGVPVRSASPLEGYFQAPPNRRQPAPLALPVASGDLVPSSVPQLRVTLLCKAQSPPPPPSDPAFGTTRPDGCPRRP
jgi:hypothetical protein